VLDSNLYEHLIVKPISSVYWLITHANTMWCMQRRADCYLDSINGLRLYRKNPSDIVVCVDSLLTAHLRCRVPAVQLSSSFPSNLRTSQARANHPAPNAWPWHNSSSRAAASPPPKGNNIQPPIPPLTLTSIYQHNTTLSAPARDPPPTAPHPSRD
jgi:hypothetical protein